MKNIIIILSAFLTGVGLTTLFLSTQVSSYTVSNQVVTSPIESTVSASTPDQTNQLTSESYTVTKVTDNPTNNDEYYAEKSDGTGVFFTSDFIQSISLLHN